MQLEMEIDYILEVFLILLHLAKGCYIFNTLLSYKIGNLTFDAYISK